MIMFLIVRFLFIDLVSFLFKNMLILGTVLGGGWAVLAGFRGGFGGGRGDDWGRFGGYKEGILGGFESCLTCFVGYFLKLCLE